MNEKEENILTFGSIWRFIKRALPAILIAIILSVIIGIGIIGMQKNNAVVNTVYAKIELTYDNAEKGLDKEGNRLSYDSFKSMKLVAKALASMESDLSPSEVRSHISVTPIFTEAEKKLMKAEDAVPNSIFPTNFALNIDYQGLGITADKGIGIINSLVIAIRGSYDNKDMVNAIIPVEQFNTFLKCNITDFSINTSRELNDMIRYENLTISNFNSQINSLQTQIDRLEYDAYTTMAVDAQTKESIINSLKLEQERYELDEAEARSNAEALKTIIEEYKFEVIVINPDGTLKMAEGESKPNNTIHVNTAYIDQVCRDHNNYIITANSYKSRIAALESKLTKVNAIIPSEMSGESEFIKVQKDAIIGEMVAIGTEMRKEILTANSNNIDQNGIRLSSSAAEIEHSTYSGNLIINLLIMIVAGIAGGIIIYVVTMKIISIRNARNAMNACVNIAAINNADESEDDVNSEKSSEDQKE